MVRSGKEETGHPLSHSPTEYHSFLLLISFPPSCTGPNPALSYITGVITGVTLQSGVTLLKFQSSEINNKFWLRVIRCSSIDFHHLCICIPQD